MLRSLTRCFLVCLWILPLVDASVAAQTQVLFSPDRTFVIHKRVEEVRVLFNVADAHGRPVLNLRPEDVVVSEDGQAVGSFTEFSRAAALPLHITILMDASASMAGNFLVERVAARRLLDAAFGAKEGSAAWASFSTEPLLVHNTEQSHWKSASLDSLRPVGPTAMLDALRVAMQGEASSSAGRRVLLLLSDGEDNASQHTVAQVLEAAQKGETAIYAVAAHDARLEFPGDRTLRRLCEATGGRFFLLPSYSRADAVVAQIQADLRSEYAVSFRPRARDARASDARASDAQISVAQVDERDHVLAIHIRNRRNLRVQAREQYFIRGDDPYGDH